MRRFSELSSNEIYGTSSNTVSTLSSAVCAFPSSVLLLVLVNDVAVLADWTLGG